LCKKTVKVSKSVEKSLSLERGDQFRRRRFHKKCWAKFLVDVFMEGG
jgi:hypothetical protein